LRQKLLPLQDPQLAIQPSLVTRDAILNEEFANCKRLSLRVASQVAGMKRRRVEADNDDDSSLDLSKMEKSKLLKALYVPI
jgi:hypothetical protein